MWFILEPCSEHIQAAQKNLGSFVRVAAVFEAFSCSNTTPSAIDSELVSYSSCAISVHYQNLMDFS